MRLGLIILFCFLFLFSACEQRRSKFIFDEVTLEYQADDEDLMKAFGSIFYLEGTDDPYTGSGTMTGVLAPKMVWQFEDGFVKQVNSYNDQDVRLRENVYQDGQTIASRTWYSTGELWVEWSKEGGFTKEYFISGELKSEVPWSSDGVIDGTVKLWDEEGNLINEEVYKNGVKVNPGLDESGEE